MRPTRLSTVVLLAGCGTSTGLAPSAEVDGGRSCSIESALEAVAGPGATFCGRVLVGDDPLASRRCAVEAVRSGRAFWTARQGFLLDVEIWHGYARAPDGASYHFSWNSAPPPPDRGREWLGYVRCSRFDVFPRDGGEDIACADGSWTVVCDR